jgi:multiple sugar transport system substrate-binding protein
MDDVNDTSGGWGEPLDRRALLEKAALAGGALAAGGLLAGRATAGREDFGTVTAFFGQYGTIAEQDALRRTILRNFDGKVDAVFAPLNTNTFVDRTRAEKKAGKGNIDVLIGLHGDFVTFQNEGLVRDISDVARQIKTLPAPLVKIGKLGTTKQYYVPHSQATYIMVANKDVLKYMPAGADINALTYGQLFQWAKTIRQKTGQNRFGMPASGTGLIHRFFQGFLVPSFSGGMVSTFRTKEAVQAWEYMRQLWKYTHPQSLTYGFMQDPLLSEEVLLAWDHVARLNRGLDQRPDDLVAFPVPRGPKSRSYMPVIVGMGIPSQAPPNLAGAKALIKYLTGLSAQAQTLSLLGFFPAVRGRLSKRLSPGLLAEAAAVAKQQAAKDSVQALLPVGIGAENGNFNKIYRDTFNRIVLNGERAQTVLKQQGDLLDEIFVKTNAPCWAPDPPSGKNRCKVK